MKQFLFVLLFSLTSFAQALDSTPEMERIIKQVMNTDGEINKELQDKFWHELNTLSKEDSDKYTKSMKLLLIPTQEYQKELWESALISYRNNEVVKTARLLELEKNIPTYFEVSLSTPVYSVEYLRETNSFKKGWVKSREHAEQLLLAAANHSKLAINEDNEAEIDEQTISFVLANLSSSFTRLNKLFERNWFEN